MNISGFLPQSFCDWPGNAAAVIFTPGCNFKCGFCHNPELNSFKETNNEELVLKKIEDLKWSLDGVVITGGEPTLQKDLINFCEKLKAMGLKVKLDSNGSNPDILQEMVDKKLIDYIAMDLKTSMEKYSEITKFQNIDNIKKSIKIIINSGLNHEFRTTFVPDVMTKQDIISAVSEIKGAKRYSLQKFIPRNCLNPEFNKYRSPSQEELCEIAKELGFENEIRVRAEHSEKIIKKQVMAVKQL